MCLLEQALLLAHSLAFPSLHTIFSVSDPPPPRFLFSLTSLTSQPWASLNNHFVGLLAQGQHK